ncbi:hypothetical protein C2S52_006877 [Perilla frutescens var. hirtella]|nr:hypothetical protein C2S52_006877 [Perilla frutescens var. hirtella]
MKDTMGVNAPDVENAGNIADITEKGKGVTVVGKRKYKQAGAGGRVFKGKGKEEVRWGDVDDKMTTRCNNLIRKTNVLVSPFIVRPIVASDKLDLKQKKLFYWIVENDESDLDEVVYSDSIMEFRQRELMSICLNQYLSSAVLDVWSVIMNHNEKLRAPNSTSTVVDAPPTWDYAKRSTTFSDRLISEIGEIIDNSSALDGDCSDPLTKYGNAPNMMVC